MKNTQGRSFLQYAFILIIALCLSLSLSTSSLGATASAASASVKRVHVGDVINASDYTINYDGGSVAAEGLTVVCPSGGVYGGDSYIFNDAGKYHVTYFANVNGKEVNAYQEYLSVRQARDIIIADTGMEITYGAYAVGDRKPTKAIYGAIASFKDGQSTSFTT